MKKEKRQLGALAVVMLAAFALWTLAVRTIDVRPIGPQGSSVGFAAINGAFHRMTGVHMALYVITDWLSMAPLMFVLGFAGLGFVQWIRRKSLVKVDRGILVLGGFYAAVMAAYLFFELCVVNCRPVLIEGILEASYPSSTTMLVLCVMPTAMIQLCGRMKRGRVRKILLTAMMFFTVLMVAARLISGVHWLSDIIGGALLSAGLVLLYAAIA